MRIQKIDGLRHADFGSFDRDLFLHKSHTDLITFCSKQLEGFEGSQGGPDALGSILFCLCVLLFSLYAASSFDGNQHTYTLLFFV